MEKIIINMKESLNSLERFGLIADELGLELTEKQQGILADVGAYRRAHARSHTKPRDESRGMTLQIHA